MKKLNKLITVSDSVLLVTVSYTHIHGNCKNTIPYSD